MNSHRVPLLVVVSILGVISFVAVSLFVHERTRRSPVESGDVVWHPDSKCILVFTDARCTLTWYASNFSAKDADWLNSATSDRSSIDMRIRGAEVDETFARNLFLVDRLDKLDVQSATVSPSALAMFFENSKFSLRTSRFNQGLRGNREM